jgi:predicted ATPase/DNA-binding CsgD family transcriptional regulator
VPTLAQTLDVKEIAGQPLLDLLKASLHWKHLLLLLDNFEQVVSAAVHVADILVACPNLKVMVTSRMTLHIRGEQEYAVPPLAVPDPKHLPDLIALSQYEAVALFIQRAQAARPDFQVTAANAPAVAEICVRLDGLPLAIELAAARIKVLPPQALLARLGQRLAVLTSGAQDAPVRQQTLRNTIAWSYHLLDGEEQRLFRRLSVFVGGCTLQAIEAIGAALDGEAGRVFEGVASLLDQSLLQQAEQDGEEPLLVILETIREFGLEALEASGEMEVTRQAHATYYLRLAEEAQPELVGPQQVTWLERLEREHDNLRAAMQWSLEQPGGDETGHRKEMALRLGSTLREFWVVHGHISEGQTFLERALARGEGVTPSVRAKALYATGDMVLNVGDPDRAQVLFEEGLALSREFGDTAEIALFLYGLGWVGWYRGNYTAVRSLAEEALALWREVGDKDLIAWALHLLTSLASQQGEYDRARALCEESVTTHRESGNKSGLAHELYELAWLLFVSQGDPATVHALLEESLTLCKELGDKLGLANYCSLAGQLALQQGDAATARSLIEESLVLYRETGYRLEGISESLSILGKVAAVQGDYTAARALYEESLAIAREVGHKLDIASCLQGLASIVAAQGEYAWAAQLWGAAESLREVMGAPIPPVYRADYERAVAAARAQLGEKAFAAAWAEGRTMTPEQALAARGPMTISPPASSISSPPASLGLTRRELEVLRLLATGLTDAQIAEQLVLSLHTIHAHLRTIYSKLGVTSRSAATRYAFEHQLV